MHPKVSVITASIAKPDLLRCSQSVLNQTYDFIQHLVFIDGPVAVDRYNKGYNLEYVYNSKECDVIKLPYSTGSNGWNGHRQYGAGTFLCEGDYVMFLDDDNVLEPNHIEKCIETINKGHNWCYSLRKIVDENNDFICNDDCESLGKWASILSDTDFFIDVNCYFFPRKFAITLAPLWFQKFRDPGKPEVDRVLAHYARQLDSNYECTHEYSVRYKAGNTANSVQKEFFLNGNKVMLQKYNGVLPWRK